MKLPKKLTMIVGFLAICTLLSISLWHTIGKMIISISVIVIGLGLVVAYFLAKTNNQSNRNQSDIFLGFRKLFSQDNKSGGEAI
jgi:uncharacterized membrane protein